MVAILAPNSDICRKEFKIKRDVDDFDHSVKLIHNLWLLTISFLFTTMP